MFMVSHHAQSFFFISFSYVFLWLQKQRMSVYRDKEDMGSNKINVLHLKLKFDIYSYILSYIGPYVKELAKIYFIAVLFSCLGHKDL